MNTIHNWLVGHPICQNLLIGVVLLIPALYSKEIRGFLETPPQRFGMWWRKARLKATYRQKAQLRQAHENIHQLFFRCVLTATQVVAALCFVLFHISTLLAHVAIPAQSYPIPYFNDRFYGGRFASDVVISLAVYWIIYQCGSLVNFARNLVHHEKTQETLDLKIKRIEGRLETMERTQISTARHESPKPASTVVSSSDSGADKEFRSPLLRKAIRVRHPKYGDGTLMKREGDGDDTKLLIKFDMYGFKKLVAKFAQLEHLD